MFIILSVPAFNIYIYLHGKKKTPPFFFLMLSSNIVGNVTQGNKDTYNSIGGQHENKSKPLPCKTLAQWHKSSQIVVDIKEDSCLEGQQGLFFRGEGECSQSLIELHMTLTKNDISLAQFLISFWLCKTTWKSWP